jgi:flagellar hook-associated protein 1 FlgK
MGVTTILDTAKQALFAQQRAIQVVGQNIANVNTPGYSRERPVFLPTRPAVSGVLKFGVSVDQVTRAFDHFIAGQVNLAATTFSSTQTQADLLSQVEAVFNDLGLEDAGLASALKRLFEDFQALASNPRGIPERTVVQTQGQAVADLFHTFDSRLEDLGRNINTTLRDELAQTNRLMHQIADLNLRVQQVETDPKRNANTLRDERDALLKALSEKVNVTSFETSDGSVTILLGGGRPLVEGVRVNELTTVSDPNDPLRPSTQMQDKQGNLIDVTSSITGGKLQGLLAVRDTFLPRFTTGLDRLAAQLVSAVNQLHSNGYGLDGSTGNLFFAPRQVSGQALADNTGGGALQSVTVFDPAQLTLDEYRITFAASGPPPTFDVMNTTTGETIAAGQTYTAGATIRFDGMAVVISDSGTAPQQGDTFTISTTRGAAKALAVDTGVLNNVKIIAAAQTPDPSDNTNALALADLGDTPLIDGITLGEFYNTLVSGVGLESQRSADLAQHQKLLLTEVENQREALSGVSLDEEQVDLIRFQQAFTAAANLIRVADEMADLVVNLIR